MSLERSSRPSATRSPPGRGFEQHAGAVQHRLSPATSPSEAWDGVKDKSADLAEGALQAVKKPARARCRWRSARFALFLAREPIEAGGDTG